MRYSLNGTDGSRLKACKGFRIQGSCISCTCRRRSSVCTVCVLLQPPHTLAKAQLRSTCIDSTCFDKMTFA
jgi:hypothetical protein